MPRESWRDDQIEKLKVLWNRGLSCSQVALMIGEGITRCAVAGKISRLGLPKRGIETFRHSHGVPRKPAGINPKPRLVVPEITPDMPEPQAIGPINDIGPGCKYPHGFPGISEWRFCGQPAEGSYCAFHRAIVYVKAPPVLKEQPAHEQVAA